MYCATGKTLTSSGSLWRFLLQQSRQLLLSKCVQKISGSRWCSRRNWGDRLGRILAKRVALVVHSFSLHLLLHLNFEFEFRKMKLLFVKFEKKSTSKRKFSRRLRGPKVVLLFKVCRTAFFWGEVFLHSFEPSNFIEAYCEAYSVVKRWNAMMIILARNYRKCS
jgi:hypothetical protein